MATYRCAQCGHTATIDPPATRKAKPPAVVDTADLSTADLFAHYKKTAPLEDVRFGIRYATLSARLLALYDDLETRIVHGLSRTDAYRELTILQAAWRKESNDRERAEKHRHAADCKYRLWFNADCSCGFEQMITFYAPVNVRGLLPAAPSEVTL